MDKVLYHPAAWPQEMEDSIAVVQGRMLDPDTQRELDIQDAEFHLREAILDYMVEGRASGLEAIMQEFI
jgi:hypothetical protein